MVHQPDGIISIITELEPEKAPVSYLQAVESPAERRAPLVVDATPSPPLAEGEFRVRSTKIRVVDPDTGFEVVHEGPVENADASITNTKDAKRSQEGDRKREIKHDSATDIEASYPSRARYSSAKDDYPVRIEDRSEFPDAYKRRRKPGRYGYQTPRREDMVRSEKTTRIKNNDEPLKVYRETLVMPASQQDELLARRKPGKTGRFVRYKSLNPSVDIDDVNDVPKRKPSQIPSITEKPGRYGKYKTQNPTPEFVGTKRFRNSHVPVPNPPQAVGEVVDNSNVGSESIQPSIPRKTKTEYSTSTVVRFPDGYAKDNEKRVESSSNYKTASNSRNNYKSPTVTSLDNLNRKFDGKDISNSGDSINAKLESDPQPIPQGSSFVTSGLDDDVVNDEGVLYAEGGYGGVGVGEGVGISSYGGIGDSYGGGFEKEKHFEKDKGKHYVADHHAAHGAKGQKGFSNEEAFSKGQSKQHGQDENKGYHKENEGEKKSHLDKSSQYAAGHQAAEGAKATDYHTEKGHRKGHKKSGFRTVQHKDEYNKKEEFFDEEHDIGGVHKEGHNTEHHSDKQGGEDKKAHLDAGHHHGSRGHAGGHEKGQGYNQHKGHRQEKTHSGHYGQEEDYGKKSGHNEGEVHGHSEFGGGYHA